MSGWNKNYMQTKHEVKVKIARKLQGKTKGNKETLFTSKAWELRKTAIAERVKRQQTKKK